MFDSIAALETSADGGVSCVVDSPVDSPVVVVVVVVVVGVVVVVISFLELDCSVTKKLSTPNDIFPDSSRRRSCGTGTPLL